MPSRRLFTLALGSVLLLSGVSLAAARHGADRAGPQLPSSYQGSVTIYSAEWCGACKNLQRGLSERQIPFDLIDVDKNPSAHARAKQATGTSAIPVTSVFRGASDAVWIIGANTDAVERAYRGR